MNGGGFKYEDCLLKHFIRQNVWLPKCKARLKSIKSGGLKAKKQPPRRLKYFTFCAVGALDVLLLDKEKILRRSTSKEFDTVFFFDRDDDAVFETRKRIPGATGFPGDFVKVVLDGGQGIDLDAPTHAANTRDTREVQKLTAQHKQFQAAFPFDVMNLDVEQYLFRPKEELPGKLTSTLRKLFDWQKQKGKTADGKDYEIDEFTLMFTTQVGPKNLADEHLQYLRDNCLQENLKQYPELNEPFEILSNGKSPTDFFSENFDRAFKLAVPKSLIELAFERDWHIDGKDGVEIFEFNRDSSDGPYTMLHLAMTVKRQTPAQERRAPGQRAASAQEEHRQALLKLFQRPPVAVGLHVVGEEERRLKADLQALFEYRKKYYAPG